MVVDDELRDLIQAQKHTGEIASVARRRGMSTLLESALKKAANGQISYEEAVRVAPTADMFAADSPEDPRPSCGAE